MSTDHLIPVVNEQDEVIALKLRSTITQTDIFRVSSLWIYNNKRQVLLAQRSWKKKNDPGKWGPSAAGTVEDGETYEGNIIKEAEEELGLKNLTIQKGKKYRNELGKHAFFCQVFVACADVPIERIRRQEEEVEQTAWVDIAALEEEINSCPDKYLPSMSRELNAIRDLLL